MSGSHDPNVQILDSVSHNNEECLHGNLLLLLAFGHRYSLATPLLMDTLQMQSKRVVGMRVE
jgi:hypothetical protein